MNILCKILGHKLTLAGITEPRPCCRKGCDYISKGIIWPKPPSLRKHIINEFDNKMLVTTFNTWNKRYAENPDSFSNSLDKDGNPIEDYGECCAIYFQKLWLELLGDVEAIKISKEYFAGKRPGVSQKELDKLLGDSNEVP